MRDGSLEALTSGFNLASRNDFILVLTWLLAALRQGGPYPQALIADNTIARRPISTNAPAMTSTMFCPAANCCRQLDRPWHLELTKINLAPKGGSSGQEQHCSDS